MTNHIRFQLILLFVLGLNIFSHIEDQFIFTVIIGGTSILWRLLYLFQKIKLPQLSLKILFSILSLILIYYKYQTFFGIEASTALLISGVSLKLIDNFSYRDTMILIFLNLLLLMSKSLVVQSVSVTLLLFINIILVLSSLLYLHQNEKTEIHLKKSVINSLKITLQISPLLILLFFVFPRFSVGFLNIHSQKKAKSGFSGNLDPGSVSSLIKSHEESFYANISPRLNTNKLYWRGEVLNSYKNLKWYNKKSSKFQNYKINPSTKLLDDYLNKKNIDNSLQEKTVIQNIILKPRFDKWLFALDIPVGLNFNDKRKQNQSYKDEFSQIYKIKKSNGQNISYSAYSNLHLQDTPITKKELKSFKNIYLKTEENNDPQFQKLVHKLKSRKNINDKIHYLLDFFKKDFKYTLSPGDSSHNINNFLFESKKGFCEHFASSMAIIMRHAGVPSRVIIGFHGGIKNKFTDFYVIRDSDAHAWLEVWANNKWLRIDPTSVVAPLRIELGGHRYHQLSEEELLAFTDESSYLAQFEGNYYYKTIGLTLLYLEGLGIRWEKFLTNYDQKGQIDLLKKLHFRNFNKKHLFYLSMTLVLLFLFYTKWINNKKETFPQEIQIYHDVQTTLKKLSIIKQTHEPPQSFLKRAQKELAQKGLVQMSQRIDEFENIFTPFVFSNQKKGQDLEKLKTLKKSLTYLKSS